MNIEKVLGCITELSESNDIYMTLDVLILTSTTNANGAKFQPDFIHEIVCNKEFYIGLPLVCERQKLEDGRYKSLTHAKKKDNTLQTQVIGSYVDFYQKEDENEWSLFGTVRVFKRYEKVCEAIRELYERHSLFFSVEVLVGEYTNVTEKTREIGASVNNKFFGDCIVSFPAESKSTAYMLIAEALDYDIGGVNEMDDWKEFFQNARISIENSELDLTQVQRKLYAKCKDKLGEEFYNYYSTDFGVNYIVMYDSYEGDYYKFDFTISDNDVILSDKYKVTKNYVPMLSATPNDDEDDLIVETGATYTIDNSKDSAMNGAWGNVNIPVVKEKVQKADNAQALASELCLILEDGWETNKSMMGYPHHVFSGNSLILHIGGVQAAMSRARSQGLSESSDAMQHLRKHYKQLDLEYPIATEEKQKEEDKMTLEELQVKLESAENKVNDLTKVVADKDALIAEKEALVTEKENLIAEKELKINELSENVNTLSETVVVKDNEIAELVVAKTELDKINLEKAEVEKAQKIVDLKTKYSKLLNEKTLVELSDEINKLNEGALQAKVTEIALEKANSTKNKDMVTSARIVDDISIHGSDIVSKYITMGR